ncbi:MAG TPA: FixH family protein [Deferrisomatales bacterium]|nr:FixH family protein [Deferrisomatales bacterium]
MTEAKPNRWPASIIALAAVFLAALGGSLYWGITRVSRVSDRAYYTRGLDYGGEVQAEQATRDWVLAIGKDGSELALHLTDGAGAPLVGLEGTLTMLAPDGADASRHELAPGQDPGVYRVALPALPAGGVRATVAIRRDGAVLHRSLLLVP